MIHNYLGLTIDFFLPGKVVYSMFEYLEDIVVEAPVNLKIGPKHKTLASAKLFTVDDDSKILWQVYFIG